jgi:ribosomal 50S subunit-associated protein YjgA (DUF615 family)
MDDMPQRDTSDTEVNEVSTDESIEEQIPDAVKTQISVEQLIKSYISRIARLKEDLKPVSEMLNDLLINNEEYKIAADAAKEASKKKSAVKKKVLSTPEGKTLNDKVSELKEDLKEAQESLSSYLTEYQRLTGSGEIEGEDGELRQIVYVAKLVRKTNLER